MRLRRFARWVIREIRLRALAREIAMHRRTYRVDDNRN